MNINRTISLNDYKPRKQHWSFVLCVIMFICYCVMCCFVCDAVDNATLPLPWPLWQPQPRQPWHVVVVQADGHPYC